MNAWPYPGDGPLARARRTAHAYRNMLAEIDPEACAVIDRQMRRWGQGWAIPRIVTYNADDMLTPAEAADLAACDPATLRQHRLRGRLTGERHGNTWKYRAGDIVALSATPRRRTKNGG